MNKRFFAVVLAIVLLFSAVFAQDWASPLQTVVTDSEASVARAITDRPSVALVLSGAGAKGLSYIPILEALETNGIPIDKVFGTSMGSLIGGLYCSGYSPENILNICKGNDLAALFTELSSSGYKEVMDAFDYNTNNIGSVTLGKSIGGASGVIDDYMILNLFERCFGNLPDDIDFNKDLVIPFECNATDMVTGKEVIFSSGHLITALRASMSIPVVFEPVRTDHYEALMDGGVVCNSMVHRAELEGFDIIICVTVSGYENQDFDASLYDSIPGVLEGWMLVSFRNTTKTLVPEADYWFGIDVNEYGILEFDKVDEIVQCGVRFLQDESQLVKDIGALFTEDKKVYRNPGRAGEYFAKYPVREKTVHLSTRDRRSEDTYGESRLSLGAFGNAGFGFDFSESDSRIKRAIVPTLSARAFFKDIFGTPISIDNKLRATVGRSTVLSTDVLFCLNPDASEKLYIIGGGSLSLDSLSHYTDIWEAVSYNEIEYAASGNAGFMMTNGLDNSLKVFASADSTWALFDGSGISRLFVPSANVSFVFYPKYENGLFHMQGGRLDVLARLGFDTAASAWVYKLGIAGENSFKLAQNCSLWLDLKAFTSREAIVLRDSYAEYGGWKGMPGYSYGTFCSDFIFGGVGVKWMITRRILSDYLAVVLRGGVRSSHFFGLDDPYGSMVPFGDCFSGLWDLGLSAGYGFATPIGDVVVGAGFNMDLKLSFYIELV